LVNSDDNLADEGTRRYPATRNAVPRYGKGAGVPPLSLRKFLSGNGWPISSLMMASGIVLSAAARIANHALPWAALSAMRVATVPLSGLVRSLAGAR
jgi:hypothetical protein